MSATENTDWEALRTSLSRPEEGSYPFVSPTLPLGGEAAVTLDGTFTAADLRRILDALENP